MTPTLPPTHKHTHTHNAKEANSATYSSHHRHTVYLCEEVVRSWRVKSTGKEPDITQKLFLLWCEDIGGELLEGEKTGHSTVETVFLFASFTPKRKICWHVRREVSARMGTSYLKCGRLLDLFHLVCVWINNYSHGYCSWHHLVLNKHWNNGNTGKPEWVRG